MAVLLLLGVFGGLNLWGDSILPHGLEAGWRMVFGAAFLLYLIGL